MDFEELSMIGPVIDLASVDAIHRKRIVAFVNHFIINTTSFLNRLSCTVESKLFQVDDRLQKLEASMVLLESKLNSIPGLEVDVPASEPVIQLPETVKSPEIEPAAAEEKKPQPEEIAKPQMDDSLLKYVKMLQFGVPIPAVKLKMDQEEISPDNQRLVLAHCKFFLNQQLIFLSK